MPEGSKIKMLLGNGLTVDRICAGPMPVQPLAPATEHKDIFARLRPRLGDREAGDPNPGRELFQAGLRELIDDVR
jgi:hypothetical protein